MIRSTLDDMAAEVCAPFCEARALRRGQSAEARKRELKRKLADRKATRGRVCRWCQATDAEVLWTGRRDECAACERARGRASCKRCQGPRATGHTSNHCPRCDGPPAWLSPVVVLDASSDRERTIYRAPHGVRRGIPRVSVAGAFHPLPEDGSPLVVELPTSVWLRTRD